jgi:CHAD domain-containing protein
MSMKRTAPAEHLIRQRLRAVTHALPAAERGHAESLHKARVATRRLREALPLVATGGRGRKLERAVRRLTRALGPVRELDVALITLDELERETPADVPRRAIATLRSVIAQERGLLHKDMCRRIANVNLGKVESRALAAAKKTRAKHVDLQTGDPKRLAAAQARARRRAAGESAAEKQPKNKKKP